MSEQLGNCSLGGYDDDAHVKACSAGAKCARCTWVKYKPVWQKELAWLDAKMNMESGSWGLGCRLCHDAQEVSPEAMSKFPVSRHHFARYEVNSGDIRVARFRKHAASPAHRTAESYLSPVCQCHPPNSSKLVHEGGSSEVSCARRRKRKGEIVFGNFDCRRSVKSLLSCCNYGCQLACAAIAIKEAPVDSCKDGGIVLLNSLSNKVQGGARGLLVLYRPNVSCCKEASAVSCCLFLPSAGSKLS